MIFCYFTVHVVKPSTVPAVTVVVPDNKTETHVHHGSKDQNIGVIAAITAGVVAIILIIGFVVSCCSLLLDIHVN